jgi:hypothetical protein
LKSEKAMIARERLGPWLLLSVALAAGSSCSGDAPDRFTDGDGERIVADSQSDDALEWLKAPAAKPKPVGNMTDDEALAVAYKFQQNGAVRLVVAAPTMKPPNGRAGMIVQLPADPSQRSALFRLYAKQVRSSGYTPQPDRDQKYLYVPWTNDGSDH